MLRRSAYRLRSTGAGFWPSAEKVPIRPSTTVTTARASTTPDGAAGLPDEGQRHEPGTISQAATEPASTPNTAVAKPSIRYSSA